MERLTEDKLLEWEKSSQHGPGAYTTISHATLSILIATARREAKQTGLIEAINLILTEIKNTTTALTDERKQVLEKIEEVAKLLVATTAECDRLKRICWAREAKNETTQIELSLAKAVQEQLQKIIAERDEEILRLEILVPDSTAAPKLPPKGHIVDDKGGVFPYQTFDVPLAMDKTGLRLVWVDTWKAEDNTMCPACGFMRFLECSDVNGSVRICRNSRCKESPIYRPVV